MSELQRLSCLKQIREKYQKLQNKKSLRTTPELLKELKECDKYIIKPKIELEKNIQRRTDVIIGNIKKINKKYKNTFKQQNAFKKIKNYILAEFYTIIKGQINKKQYTQRKAACLGCHGRVDSIEGKIDPGGIGFCSLCGCGASKRAALSVKLTIGGASCPLNKWEPLRGSEWSFKIAIEAILGLCSSVVYHVKKKIYNFIRNLVFRRSI